MTHRSGDRPAAGDPARAVAGSASAETGSASPGPPTVLARILEQTRAELERRKHELPLERLAGRVAGMTDFPVRRSSSGEPAERRGERAAVGAEVETASADRAGGRFHRALARPGIGVIAEFKRRSPSAGRLREQADVTAVVRAYERAGASALSVLTEGANFEGSLEDLRAARTACGLPILRKDFIVDPYQLYEAKEAGADAVLLIAAALEQRDLATLHARADALGLDVLVEVHDRLELARARDVGARLIGVNNRDLRDFTVDVERTSQLLGEMPAGALVVSESGIAEPEQLRELERRGVAAVLVGEALMRAEDPREALVALLGSSTTPESRENDPISNFIKSDDHL